MSRLQDDIEKYRELLHKGGIQNAYKGILSFMSRFQTAMKKKYPDYQVGSLYPGYMDMTFFAITPNDLAKRKLKIALVYLHEQGCFEVWLCGSNRQIQTEFLFFFRDKELNQYRLSRPLPGVDSIIEYHLDIMPDFDHQEHLMPAIEQEALAFIRDIRRWIGK